jgi:O-antigen/teichoic acid export membrane protein
VAKIKPKDLLLSIISKSKDPLVFGSAIFFLANIGSSFFGYLFQLLAGRLLAPIHYGELVSLFAFLAFLTIPQAIINPAVVKRVSEAKAKRDFTHVSELFGSLAFVYGILGVFIFGFFVLFNFAIGSYLRILDNSTLLAFYIFLALGFVCGLPILFLQGLTRFKGVAFVTSVSNLFKLIFGIGALVLYRGVWSMLYGLSLGGLLVFAIGFITLKKNLIFKDILRIRLVVLWHLLKYAFPASLIVAPITLLVGADMVFAKHILDPYTAGVFAGISIIGKIIFFAVATFATIIFPLISEKSHKKENSLPIFKKTLFIYLILLSSAIAIYNLFPESINSLLFGGKYKDVAKYLGIYSIYISILSLVNLFATFYMAIPKFSYGIILIVGFIGYFFLANFYAKNILQLIYSGIVVLGAIIVATVVYHQYVFIRNSSGVQAGKDD